jgi:hypothetical protein
MAAVVRAAREAGASYVWANVVNLRPGTREHFLEALGRDWPELLPRYERLFAGRGYLPRAQTDPVHARGREWTERYGIGVGGGRPPGATGTGTDVEEPGLRQLELADALVTALQSASSTGDVGSASIAGST